MAITDDGRRQIKLPLPLLVLRLTTANHSNNAFALDNAAIFTAWFYRCSDLHLILLASCWPALPAAHV